MHVPLSHLGWRYSLLTGLDCRKAFVRLILVPVGHRGHVKDKAVVMVVLNTGQQAFAKSYRVLDVETVDMCAPQVAS